MLRTMVWMAVVSALVLSVSERAQAQGQVSELSKGRARFEVRLPSGQAYVELFVRQNGLQNVAQAVQKSEHALGDGTSVYSLVKSGFHAGDRVEYRFYSYLPRSPGVFTPGPAERVWQSHTYGEKPCSESFVASDASYCLDPVLAADGTLSSEIVVAEATASEAITPFSCGWYLTLPTLKVSEPLLLDTAKLLAVYVQRCDDGAWVKLADTPYVPARESESVDGTSWSYEGDPINTTWPGQQVHTTYACGGSSVTLSTCGGPMTIVRSGEIKLAYVVQHTAN
jgi:hypothetical protein